MWNLGWISLRYAAFQTSYRGAPPSHRHTSCSPGKGNKKTLFPSTLPAPPLSGIPFSAFSLHFLSTRLPRFFLSTQGWHLRGCSNCLFPQKVNEVSPSVAVCTAGFDMSRAVHIRAWVRDWGQSGGGELVFAQKLLHYFFLRQMIPLGVDYVGKALWYAVFLLLGPRIQMATAQGRAGSLTWWT